MDSDKTATEGSAPDSDPIPPARPVLVIEPQTTQDQDANDEDLPASLTPLSPMAPSLHSGLPIGRARSTSNVSRGGSDSSHAPQSGSGHASTRPALPGGAAALVLPSNPNRISVLNMSGPTSPTSPSSTHIGNVLAPASFFRPARPSQHGHQHTAGAVSSARVVSHAIGPTPASPRNSLVLGSPGSPRKSGAIPDGAIPLTSFAARRASIQARRLSRGSMSASDAETDVFGPLATGVHPNTVMPMASREPLLTHIEREQKDDATVGVLESALQPAPGIRRSIERMFRRSFSGDSLKPSTPRAAAPQPVPEDVKGYNAAPRRQRFAPLPPVHSTVVAPVWMKPVITSSGHAVRNYELHRGANRFLLGGRLVLGGDTPWAFIGTLVVYCFFVGFWMGTTCVYWWHNLSPALAIVGAYLALVTLSSLLATAFRDPGILPRDLDLDAPVPIGAGSDTQPLPREIRVREEVVRTKYCVTCRTYRPPRSSHCRNCDNCVDGCDHHCPWVNNCVGRRNYGSFITCLVSAVLSLALIAVTSAIHLRVLASREDLDFAHTLREGFGSAVTFIAACIFIWPVSILAAYHVRLLYLNTTTIEQVRNKAHKSLGAGAGPLPPNPFTYGRWWYNMGYLLCRPPGYSWIAPQDIATEDRRERCLDDATEYDDDDERWSRSDL